jgi:hypothetical protein
VKDTPSDALVDFTWETQEEAIVPEVNNETHLDASVEETAETGNDLNLDFSLTPDEVPSQPEVSLGDDLDETPALDLWTWLGDDSIWLDSLKNDIQVGDTKSDDTQAEDINLDTAVTRFITQITTIKDKNLVLIAEDEKEIETLEWEIKWLKDKITQIKSTIKSLKDDNDKIDSKIGLLTGEKTASFNRTRKKAA